jgi:hypothetical protein
MQFPGRLSEDFSRKRGRVVIAHPVVFKRECNVRNNSLTLSDPFGDYL